MKVLSGGHQSWQVDAASTAVTIGVYDGVHRGHQAVIASLEATGLPVGVVTFRHHPLAVVAPEAAPPLITTLDQRLELLRDAGVHLAAVLDFDDELRRQPAVDFVREVIVERLRAKVVAVGAGFRYGRGREGDVALLARLGTEWGFEAVAVDLLSLDGDVVSSSEIRRLLTGGDVAGAARLLGRPFRIRGEVVVGDRRGRTIGFPTANIALDPTQVRVPRGVYAVRVRGSFGGRDGVANVGVRPTFDGVIEQLEVHLFDLDQDLYGSTLEVDVVEHLRDERRFDGIDELVDQIRRDVDRARSLLAG